MLTIVLTIPGCVYVRIHTNAHTHTHCTTVVSYASDTWAFSGDILNPLLNTTLMLQL